MMVQEEDPADVEWELLACIALLQHMAPPQALEQTSLLVSFCQTLLNNAGSK